MATKEGNSGSQSVQDFLDKEFGENLDELDDLLHLIEKKSRYQEILRSEISNCTKSAKVNKEKAKSAGKKQAAEVNKLLDGKNETEHEVSHYLMKNNDFIGKLKQWNQSIEEVNCVQIYLSWLTQVIHMSSELKNELSSGHLEIAVEYFNDISDVSRQISESKCDNLVDYMTTLKDYWFNVLSHILIKEMDRLLDRMKWPFLTGTSSPMLSEKTDEEIMSKFTVVARLILKINSQYFSLNPIGNEDKTAAQNGSHKCLLLTEVLVRPLQKRFSYHFYGTRRTNNLEKPEWYFTQILNWIRDHSPFIETYIQSIVDNEGLQSRCIQHEFIKLLVETAIEKVKQSLPQIMSNEALFSHMVDEVVLFDNELCVMFDYPSSFSGCTSVIMTQPYLDQWVYLEEKCGTEAINNLLSQNDAFTSKFEDFGIISNSKVPYSVENAVTLISLITDKYKGFKDVEAQLKFVDLQLHLLAYLTSRLQDLGSLESTLCDHKVLFAVLNGCQFLDDVINEWTEDVFFIKLHCVKSQLASKGFSNRLQLDSVRLDDSVTEDFNDVSEDIEADQENSYLESGLFDDVINSVANLAASLMEKALKSIERDFVENLVPYKDERWHCMPSSQDVVKFMLPSSACTLFMAVKEVVRTMHNELYSTTFTKLWQKYARMVDSHIFNEVILANHFNEGGASQLKFDLTKNLFVLFEEHTSKPEHFFRLTMESCILLNLLPGSAVLLREVLMNSSKDETDAINSLCEIGVANILPESALQILNSRIDWPKI